MGARHGQLEGVVQGVGFRPFVAGLARELGLRGFVENLGGQVELLIEGEPARLDAFVQRLPRECPSAAHIEAARWHELDTAQVPPLRARFEIRAREASIGGLGVGPDLRICPECLAELDDPSQRRHDYALNACTACGPRLTITARSPWTRTHSAMARFEPCPACAREFADSNDRRWHAEAIACPACGPRLRAEQLDGRLLAGPSSALELAAEALRRGQIVGLKGVGGFQLLVDACDEAAVARLRARKRRPHKPLALVVASISAASELCVVDAPARAALEHPAGPIVVLPRQHGPTTLAEAVAPGLTRLGLMLPTTGAHARLLALHGGPLVATSGNIHGRPIATCVAEAREQLAGVADLLLVHEREILRRCDDSLVQVVAGELRVLRLARGFAPARFELEGLGAPRLALGAHLQHTPALAREGRAFVWPYVGDLDEPEAREAMSRSLDDLCALLGAAPTHLVCDAHPDYASTVWAEAARRRDPQLRIERVWHHHAHVASVLAEHGRERALGVAWDGAGLGPDRSSWGGECLRVEGARAQRVAHVRPFPLPGGDAAARDGLRVLAGMLVSAQLPVPIELRLPEFERFMALARRPRLSPTSSAVGRLFDAFAALVGLCRHSRYQAEAACALERAAAAHGPAPAYPFGVDEDQLDWRPMLAGALAERGRPGLVAARVHATLIAMILAVVERERPPAVALAGGCFANTVLLGGTLTALRRMGVEGLAPQRLPPGDGGLALGQAWVSAWREREGGRPCA